MLHLHNIRKSYSTAGFTQLALNDVSVTFRDNEFVAILGPSGSGKTTLLNIVGGLDTYDSGDLVIDGVSTKEYKDKDWDTYRNNRVGFVFQSYNLIPHQTVLANVELALTLSGVSRAERRERAAAALQKVGLGNHANKKPNQLSGGQMQRVAIARALINDPEILLADEPTGALDSKTSVQIMDLLTEIARDRLVVMVTHNPELAEQYATRIVTLTDGVIVYDTDPAEVEPETHTTPLAPAAVLTNKRKNHTRRTSMPFLTALALSFKNLMSKKGRTLMTAFAGSIGIIGIASILALANGVNDYIKSVEAETLSQYPLEIQKAGFDMMAAMTIEGPMVDEATPAPQTPEAEDNTVGVHDVVTSIFGSVNENDLASLKNYLDSGQSGIEEYTRAVEYSYSVEPQIFSANAENPRQVHPDKSLSALGLGSDVSPASSLSQMHSTDVFHKMPENAALYENQYDVKAGRWPATKNELVCVLTPDGTIPDLLLYTLDLRDTDELDAMIKQFAAEEEVELPTIEEPTFDDILNAPFKLVQASSLYEHNEDLGAWVSKADDTDYMKEVVAQGQDLHIVGIVQARPDADATMLKPGINYPTSLTTYVMKEANKSAIVADQLANPDIDVFTGKPFGEEEDEAGFDMTSLFTIDGEAIQAAFRIDEEKLAADMANAMSMQDSLQNMGSTLPDMPAPNIDELVASFDFSQLSQDANSLMVLLMEGYTNYLESFYAANPPLLPDGSPNPAYNPTLQPQSPEVWMARPEVQAQIAAAVQNMTSQGALVNAASTSLQSYMQTTMTAYAQAMATEVQTQVANSMQQAMGQMASSLASALSIDPEAFKNAFHMNMSEEDLGAWAMSLMRVEDIASLEGNLKKLGYADVTSPDKVSIYPIDFQGKEEVVSILEAYNDRMSDEGSEDKVISYTDFVGMLMGSVTDIVNMISAVLVAFVSIALVVSSIMIGIITYISVLERKKEIGILRAIGASKCDIGHVFNAETVIVGFAAGVIGIGLTMLACLPVNAAVDSLFDVQNVAALPKEAAVILVGVSVLLTFLAGLIPSSAASRKDPVEALRSE